MAVFHKYNAAQQRKHFASWNDPYLKSSVPTTHIWRPQANGPTYHFRIMPSWSVRGELCLDVPTYYQRGLSQYSFISPHYFEAGTCPFMNAFFAMKPHKKGYPDLKQHPDFAWDWAQVNASTGWFYNVVVFEEQMKGPQIWKATFKSEKYLEQLQQGDYGDISDPEFGYNLSLKVEAKGQNFNEYIIMTDPKGSSPIADLSWAEKLFNIDECLQRPDLADVQAAFDSIPWRSAEMKEYVVGKAGAARDEEDIPTQWPTPHNGPAERPVPAPKAAVSADPAASTRAGAFANAQAIRDKLRAVVTTETPPPVTD